MQHMVSILPSSQLDRSRWDACIQQSMYPLIYACSWYLDRLADHWHGIVYGEYEAVMPVPWRKKMGIRYCYQVPFVQQLGWFSQTGFTGQSVMLEQLFTYCRYGDYAFNHSNTGLPTASKQLVNYAIPLDADYATLVKSYNADLLNNLKKAAKQAFIYRPMQVDAAISLYRQLYASRTPHVSSADFQRFLQLCTEQEQQGNALAKCITDSAGNVQAAALLLKFGGRLYNMMNSTPKTGRKTAANHYLFDQIIQEFAGSGLTLDFEGSDIAGIRAFYEKFGGINQPYACMHFNRLPFPLRLLKR